MRTFKKTHPWITFAADLRSAPVSLWILLGECQSKCEHIAAVPLQARTAEKLHTVYLAKGAHATTAIEGNTLSEEEVLDHLEGKLELPPSREYLAQEIDNIVSACNLILGELREGRQHQLTPSRLKELNRMVLQNLTVEDGVVPGEVRKYAVGVPKYRGAPAEDCEYLIERLCQWLNGPDFEAPEDQKLGYAIIKSVLAHLYIAWIHPFGDGNGRTARFVEFQLLLFSGVPAPAAQLLSNHYNQTRTEYYRQLDQASKTGGDVVPFLTYAVHGFVEGVRAQLAVIREQQWTVAWESFISDIFRQKSGKTSERRKTLILDISMRNVSVPLHQLTEVSPRVAVLYASLSNRTLLRDVKALLAENLVKIDAEGIRANKELVLAFLPTRAHS